MPKAAFRLDPAKVGARIRALRQAHGLSQRELAVDGVTFAYISRIEHGSRVPSVQAMVALADMLGTTAQYLAFGRRRPAVCPFCGRAQDSHARDVEVAGEAEWPLPELDGDGG